MVGFDGIAKNVEMCSNKQLEDNNLLVLHAEYANGTTNGISRINDASILSQIGTGSLYKEAAAERSAKQMLGVSQLPSLDTTPSSAIDSPLPLSTVVRCITQSRNGTEKLSETDVVTSSMALPLGAVAPRTKLSVASCKYRIVFTIDASTSMASIDPISGEVLFDQLYFCVERVLTALVRPIRIGSIELTPIIHASFVLQGAASGVFHVMLHGLLISAETLSTCLQQLRQELTRGESVIISKTVTSPFFTGNQGANNPGIGGSGLGSVSGGPASSVASSTSTGAPGSASPAVSASSSSTSSVSSSGVTSSGPSQANFQSGNYQTSSNASSGSSQLQPPSTYGFSTFSNPDLGSPLKNAMFVLKMLPLDACPVMVLLTDGVTMLPEECEAYDSLLMLMSREDIVCNAIQVGSGYHDFSSFAYVPDSDFVKHFVSCAGGSYFDYETLMSIPIDLEDNHDDTRDNNEENQEEKEKNSNLSEKSSLLASNYSKLPLSVRANHIQSSLLFRSPLGGEKTRPKVAFSNPNEFGDLSVPSGAPGSSSASIASNPQSSINPSIDSVDCAFPWEGSAPKQMLYRIPFRQYQLIGVNVMELLSCRYREGFTVHKLRLDGKSPYEFSAKLSIPWKEHIFIVYTVKATYYNDIPNATPEIHVALDMLAHYDIQGQWSQMLRSGALQAGISQNSSNAAPGSASINSNAAYLIYRLQQYLLSVIDTDKKLSGITSQTILLNEIMGRSLQTPLHVQIEKIFWKCMTQLPKSMWHRWFKMGRMEIVLAPDLLLNSTSSSSAAAAQQQATGSTRIELRRRAEDLIQHQMINVTASGSVFADSSGSSASRHAHSSSYASNSSSSSSSYYGHAGEGGHGQTFRFDSATKDLQTYFENWNCFSGSKHSFARILEHTLVTGTTASQIIASIASKPEFDPTAKQSGLQGTKTIHPEARTLTVPGYVVARLTWESKNVAMLSFYFFGVHSADRHRILHGIQQDLIKRTNPNDPTNPLFSICSKPLRYSLVRYPMAQLKEIMGSSDNVPSLLSNQLPTLLTPVPVHNVFMGGAGAPNSLTIASGSSSASAGTSGALSGSMIVSGATYGTSSSSGAPSSTTAGSFSGISGGASHVSSSDRAAGASSSTETTSNRSGSKEARSAPPQETVQVPVLYQTEDVNLRALATFSPIYHLLVHYMLHKRWIWNINSEVTQEAAIEAIVRCRLSEGFLLLANAEPPAQTSSSNAQSASSSSNATGSASQQQLPSPNQRHLLHSFFKEIKVSSPYSSSSASSSLGISSRDSVDQLCVVQYLTYHTPQGYLVTELWVEPVSGSTVQQQQSFDATATPSTDDSASASSNSSSFVANNCARDAFLSLKRLIYEVDLHVISTISTFDTLSLLHNPHTTRDILSVPTEVKEYPLESIALGDVTVQRPPFNLKGLTAVAVHHEEVFTGFEHDDNTPLHKCLHASLSYICDRQLPNKGTFSTGEPDTPVFTKALPNSPELLLIALQPLYSASQTHSAASSSLSTSAWSASVAGSGNSTPLYNSTPTHPTHMSGTPKLSVSASPGLGGSIGNTMSPYTSHVHAHHPSQSGGHARPSSIESTDPTPLTHPRRTRLCVSVYQCSRVVEPPADATNQIRRIVGGLGPTSSSEDSQTAPSHAGASNAAAAGTTMTSAIHHICESLQTEHHRGFVKSLFQKLTNGKASEISPQDHSYALQICPEYMMEMDLTQFFRIVAKYNSQEEEMVRRSHGSAGGPLRGTGLSLGSIGSFGSDGSSPLDAPSTLDTALLFDRLLAYQFRKVPNTEVPFFFSAAGSHNVAGNSGQNESDASSDVDSDATGSVTHLDEDVAVHLSTNSDDHYDTIEEQQEDIDEWVDDLSKRYRSAAVITSASATGASNLAAQQHSAQIISQALAIWSTLPLFIRMECAIVPKPGSTPPPLANVESVNNTAWGESESSATMSSAGGRRGSTMSHSNSPRTARSLRPSNVASSSPNPATLEVPLDGYNTPSPLNITSFPIATLPNPKQISALQQLSTSGHRAFLRVYALVLPKKGESLGGYYDNNSPGDIMNSPLLDGNSPLAFGGPLSAGKEGSGILSRLSSSATTNAYTKLPKKFKQLLDQLKASVRSLTAQKSLDILRTRVPVTRVISDIVSMNMKQLNPNAYTTMKVPMVFVDPQQGISLFFNEFAKWSLQPIRSIDRTLFFVVHPLPSMSSSHSHAMSIGMSIEHIQSSSGGAQSPSSPLHGPHTSSNDSYSIPYWLFMSPSSTHVHIRFQSAPGVLKKHEKKEILEKTRESINFVVKRINQIILLTQLYDQRVCNVLLTSDPNNPTSAPFDEIPEPQATPPSSSSTRPQHSVTFASTTHSASMESPSPSGGQSKPISIPKPETKEKKRGARTFDSPSKAHGTPTPLDEEGIFEDDVEVANNADTDSPRGGVPEAPKLPRSDSPLRGGSNAGSTNTSSTPRSHTTFRPAQFSCDKVHEIVIPLNWRTDSKTILNAIAGSVLVHFSVSNRPKMYVYREQSGRIFYMTLAITSNEGESTGISAQEISDAAAPSGRNTSHSRNTEPSAMDLVTSSLTSVPDSLPHASEHLNSSTHGSTNVSATQSNASSGSNKQRDGKSLGGALGGETVNYLTLTVYGIDTPSEEITVQLRSLLESKLAYFTLQVISTMLLRNPLMKIKPADELFLRPPESAPRHFQIELPAFITDLQLFKAFMKANLLKQGLTLLNLDAERATSSSDVSGMATGGGSQRSGRTPEASESLLATPDTQAAANAAMGMQGSSRGESLTQHPSGLFGDAGSVYLYNNLVSGSTMASSKGALNFGTGLATLSVTIQTPFGTLGQSSAQNAGSTDDFSIGSTSSYETGPLFEPLSLEESPMHDLFLNVLSSSEVGNSDILVGPSTAPIGRRAAAGTIDITTSNSTRVAPNTHLSTAVSMEKPNTSPRVVIGGVEDEEDDEIHQNDMRSSSAPVLGRPLTTSVDIKVWTKGAIEVQRIVEHMEKVVNQTTAEYQFEWYAYLAEATRQGPMDYNQFLTDVQMLLEHATKLDTPSIRTLNVPINVPSWAVTSYLREIQKRFSEVNTDLHPDIFCIEVSSELPCAPYHRQQQIQHLQTHPTRHDHHESENHKLRPSDAHAEHHQHHHHTHHHHGSHTSPNSKASSSTAAGWVPYDFEVAESKPAGELADPSANLFFRSTRRFSILCTKDSIIRAWNPKQTSLKVGRETLAARSVLARSSHPAPMLGSGYNSTGNSSSNLLASGMTLGGGQSGGTFFAPTDPSFPSVRSLAVMFLDTSKNLQLYAYNWTPTQLDTIAQSLLRDTNFLNLRQHLVGNILHQKMGLFHHNAPMHELTTITPPAPSTPAQNTATSYRSAPQLSKMGRFLPPPALYFPPANTSNAPTTGSISASASSSAITSTVPSSSGTPLNGMTPSPSMSSVQSATSSSSLNSAGPGPIVSTGTTSISVQSTAIIVKFTYENLEHLSQTSTLPTSLPKQRSISLEDNTRPTPSSSPSVSPGVSRSAESSFVNSPAASAPKMAPTMKKGNTGVYIDWDHADNKPILEQISALRQEGLGLTNIAKRLDQLFLPPNMQSNWSTSIIHRVISNKIDFSSEDRKSLSQGENTVQNAANKVKRRSAFAIKLNDLKIDEILRRVAPLTSIPFQLDPVSRHASQFVAISERYMRYHQFQQTLLSVYTKWSAKNVSGTKRIGPTQSSSSGASSSASAASSNAPNASNSYSANNKSGTNSNANKGKPNNTANDDTIDTTQLQALLHAARLISSTKIPIFLSDMFIKADSFEGPASGLTHPGARHHDKMTPSGSATSVRSEAADSNASSHSHDVPTMRIVPLVPASERERSLNSSPAPGNNNSAGNGTGDGPTTSSTPGPAPTAPQAFLYSAGETTVRVISRPELNLRFEPSPNLRERQLKYRQELLNCFFDEFTTYLGTFGVKPVNVKPTTASNVSPNTGASSSSVPTTPNVNPHHHHSSVGGVSSAQHSPHPRGSHPNASTPSHGGSASQASSPIGAASSSATGTSHATGSHRASHSLSPSDTKESPLLNPGSQQQQQPPLDICPPKQQRYLQKVFRGGLILFEIDAGGPDNFFVSCNLFTLFFHRLTAYFGGSEDVIGTRSSANRRHLTNFTREISNIKTQLHMNSFVYDFHVRHLSNLFTSSLSSKDVPPKTAISDKFTSLSEPSPPIVSNQHLPSSPLPSSSASMLIAPTIPPVEVINQLQAMVLYYEHPPKHSRTALATSHITLDVTNAMLSPLELFAYATKHAKKFGFQGTDWGLTPGVARVATTHELDFSSLASNATAVHAEYIPNPGMVGGHRIREKEADADDSWLLIAFMSHTSDATSATNEAISSLMSGGQGGSRALESGYNACYRVARQKHLAALSVSPQNHSSGAAGNQNITSSAPIHSSSASQISESSGSTSSYSNMPSVTSQPASATAERTPIAATTSALKNSPADNSNASSSQSTAPGGTHVALAQTPSVNSPIKLRSTQGSSATTSSSQLKPPKQLTISFFVLRVSKATIFPLMSSAYSTPAPTSYDSDESSNAQSSPSKTPEMAASTSSPSPSLSLAAYNRRNMSSALENYRELLSIVATRCIVESERDLLWSKLVVDNSGQSGSDFVNAEQVTQLLNLAYSRAVSDLDASLTSMTAGISTDWKSIMNQIASSFSQVYRTRVFLDSAQQPHLLIFNTLDSDLLVHLSIPDPKRIGVECVRREYNETLKIRHQRLESAQVSQIVNTICHLLWKQLLPKPPSRR